MLISEAFQLKACAFSAAASLAASAAVLWRAQRLLDELPDGGWPEAAVFVESPTEDRLRALLAMPYPGRVEFLLVGDGGLADRLRDPRLRSAGPEPLARVSAGGEAVVWLDASSPLEPLTQILARVPSHRLDLEGGSWTARPLGPGLRGFLTLGRLLGPPWRAGVLAHLPSGLPAALRGPASAGLLSARNHWENCARLSAWLFAAGGIAGMALNAYFLFWALRPWPTPRWRLAKAAVAAQAVEAAMILGAASLALRRRGGARMLKCARGIYARETRLRAEALARTLADLVPRGAVVLDLGAGEGALLSLLRERRAIRGIGLDIVPRAIGGIEVLGYSGGVIPLPERSVEISLAVSTLHHCEDPVGALRELRRVTSGRALVFEDSSENLYDWLLLCAAHVYAELLVGVPWSARAFRSSEGWARCLAEAGWRVVERRAVDNPWSEARYLRRMTLLVAEPA